MMNGPAARTWRLLRRFGEGDLHDPLGYAPDPQVAKYESWEPYTLEQLREETRQVLEQLMDLEKEILMQRFCFNTSKKRTLRSIAYDYGISPETVRQIEKRALLKLRKQFGNMQEFLYH